MAGSLKEPVASALKQFATPDGEKRLRVAALWEKVVGGAAAETQILKLENHLIFIKVRNSVLAQELKVRFQKNFLERFEKEFGEKLKDIRFMIGSI
jgi:hypothetical protein